MSFSGEKFAFLLSRHPSHIKHLFPSTASCRHAERIFCNITEIWKLQPAVSPTHKNVSTPFYHKLSVAFNFMLMSLPHALSQHSVTRAKNFLSRSRPAPCSTGARPARIALQGSHIHRANAGTRKPRGLISPAF